MSQRTLIRMRSGGWARRPEFGRTQNGVYRTAAAQRGPLGGVIPSWRQIARAVPIGISR
jgi:hypothetical protein